MIVPVTQTEVNVLLDPEGKFQVFLASMHRTDAKRSHDLSIVCMQMLSRDALVGRGNAA